MAFADIDLSLDPFPQNGGASTWESLYMGVPVVTKLGENAGGRIGGAIMTAVGLAEFVVNDDNDYLAVAEHWANRPDELAALRREMRGRIAHSEAGDPVRYCRHLEALYRRFWVEFCASPSTDHIG
jgi:predicted O-linked N-acetylglucosamine transferase (SPINDLY family)